MTVAEYFNRPNQMAYHNLCNNVKPPDGIGTTLGLGLKFCIQTDKPTNTYNSSFTRFTDDLRKKYIFAGKAKKETPKKILVKSDWIPDYTTGHVEDRLSTFCKSILTEHNFIYRNHKKSSNLTHLQKYHLNYLRNNRNFIVLATDKNLGPAIMERDNYIQNVLKEHLMDENTYERLEELEALKIIEKTQEKAMEIVNEYRSYLSPEEYKYFTRSFIKNNRHPQFYGAPKVHKNKFPTPMRPVVSQCGSIFAVISIFIDFKLQSLTKHLPSYLKNSTALLNILDNIGTLPPSAKLFTSDAVSMYSNIDPQEGLPILEKYLEDFRDELDDNSQEMIKVIIELTKIVMHNNVFQFGSTWWRQKIGTAMGTPCACIYATIFFAYFERTLLLPKYKNNFIVYKRQIDDIFAIWKDDPTNPNAWDNFKKDLNEACKLE